MTCSRSRFLIFLNGKPLLELRNPLGLPLCSRLFPPFCHPPHFFLSHATFLGVVEHTQARARSVLALFFLLGESE
jgi:hypothetical protein